jgi:hypothetical protein
LLAVHRKVHLFDIDVPGKIRFQESEVLTGGETLTDFDTDYGKLGVAICYDVRFPEMAMIAARKGAVAMIYPGAFNLTYVPKMLIFIQALVLFTGNSWHAQGLWTIKSMLQCVLQRVTRLPLIMPGVIPPL